MAGCLCRRVSGAWKRVFDIAATAREHLVSGLVGLVLLLATECAVVLLLRGDTIGQCTAGRDPVAGFVYLLLLLIFAIMSWIVSKKDGG